MLLDFMDRKSLTLEAIVLTHGHLDHAGGVTALCRGLEAQGKPRPAVIGPDERDAFLLSSITDQARHFGLSGLENASVDALRGMERCWSIWAASCGWCMCPATHPAMLCWWTSAPALPLWVMCCSVVLLAAQILLMAMAHSL